MMEKTYFMIKPEIVAADDQRIGAILEIVNTAGFRITKLELREFDRSLVEEFYAEHVGKPFFGALCDYITSGSVVAMINITCSGGFGRNDSMRQHCSPSMIRRQILFISSSSTRVRRMLLERLAEKVYCYSGPIF